MAFEKLNHTTLAKQVAQLIRRQIFSGLLKAGDRVLETEIAKEMGISRGPVREGLGELQRDGLIENYPRKGTYVANFTCKDIEEIYTLRALLESYAVTQAIDKFNEQDLVRLRDILDKIEEMVAKNDILEVAEYNMQFHEEICKLSGNQRLLNTWRSLLAQIRMLSTMATEFYISVEDIRKRHEILVDSLIKKDKSYAKECFEKHILDYMEELVEYIRKIRQQEPST